MEGEVGRSGEGNRRCRGDGGFEELKLKGKRQEDGDEEEAVAKVEDIVVEIGLTDGGRPESKEKYCRGRGRALG